MEIQIDNKKFLIISHSISCTAFFTANNYKHIQLASRVREHMNRIWKCYSMPARHINSFHRTSLSLSRSLSHRHDNRYGMLCALPACVNRIKRSPVDFPYNVMQNVDVSLLSKLSHTVQSFRWFESSWRFCEHSNESIKIVILRVCRSINFSHMEVIFTRPTYDHRGPWTRCRNCRLISKV